MVVPSSSLFMELHEKGEMIREGTNEVKNIEKTKVRNQVEYIYHFGRACSNKGKSMSVFLHFQGFTVVFLSSFSMRRLFNIMDAQPIT
jgi:hypothetical protein